MRRADARREPPAAPARGAPLRHHLAARLDASIAAIGALRGQLDAITAVADAVVATLRSGGTVYTCGNGGSAAQALHLAEELIGRYRSDRPPQRAVCLNADPTALTCIANDYGFEEVFARQCTALLGAGDALVVLSTSGKSANLVRALHVARARGAAAIGLLGRGGGECLALCDHALVAPGADSAPIQEAHQVVIHLVCEALEGPA
jgi:D-sedoheptulose 7-phosphate isomerase